MPYDEPTAERIRGVLKRRKGISERKMFGGIAFLLNGNMCCGVSHKRLMLRLGKENAAQALTEPHTRPMDFTGKPMSTMIFVDPAGIADDEDLRSWIERAIGFVRKLPPK